MSHKKAVLITCCVAFLWSLAGWNIKMIQWSPFAIAGGRSMIAAILLLPVMIKKLSRSRLPQLAVLSATWHLITVLFTRQSMRHQRLQL